MLLLCSLRAARKNGLLAEELAQAVHGAFELVAGKLGLDAGNDLVNGVGGDLVAHQLLHGGHGILQALVLLDYNKVRMADELSEELAAEGNEELSFVWDAVKALPTTLRAVIHLFYHEGYSTAEIARLLGRNEATVRSDLHRGRARLKETLREAYDFE